MNHEDGEYNNEISHKMIDNEIFKAKSLDLDGNDDKFKDNDTHKNVDQIIDKSHGNDDVMEETQASSVDFSEILYSGNSKGDESYQNDDATDETQASSMDYSELSGTPEDDIEPKKKRRKNITGKSKTLKKKKKRVKQTESAKDFYEGFHTFNVRYYNSSHFI